MSKLRKYVRARRRRSVEEEIFRERAERLTRECGWCGKGVGEDDPVYGVSAVARKGIDLSLVQGKVIELVLGTSDKVVLVAVSAFDSPAKAEGADLVGMTCSEECGRRLKLAFQSEIARNSSLP